VTLKSFFSEFKIPLLSLALILVSLSFSLSLVRQNASLENKAAGTSSFTCQTWSGGQYSVINSSFNTRWFDPRDLSSDSMKKIVYKGQVDLGHISVFRCDYQKLMEKKGSVRECTTEDDNTWIGETTKPHHETSAIHSTSQNKYTQGLVKTDGSLNDNLIDMGHYDGQCQVIQVDVSPCSGGTKFVVYANDVCPSVTLTPTPSPAPVPAVPSCSNFSIGGLGPDTNDNGILELQQGLNYNVRFTTANTGLRDYRLRERGTGSVWGNWERVSGGLTLNDGWNFFPFASLKPGVYQVGVNVFNADCFGSPCQNCNLVCATDSKLYSVSGCEYSGLAQTSVCTNKCSQVFEIIASPKVTPVPLSIQGRIYEDKDKNVSSVGRGGFTAGIPPKDSLWTGEKGNPGYSIPLRIDLATNLDGRVFTTDVADFPNMTDVCSDSSKQEKQFCGRLDNPGDTHCSKYGGFALVIPVETTTSQINGELYYVLRLRLGDDAFRNGWRVSEAYWMTTATTVEANFSSYPHYDFDKGVKCDYPTQQSKEAQCNQCTTKDVEVIPACLANSGGKNCSLSSFNREVQEAYIYIPVNGVGENNLWIGVYKASGVKPEPTSWWQRWLKYLGL